MTALLPVRNPLLAWRMIEGEVVVISPEDSSVHELNDTASFIWNAMNGERTSAEIAALLSEEYDVLPEVALAHTQELIASLQEKKLLLVVQEVGNEAHV
jgi:Coenzyme PQQ synthesis protein D (PqqD)